MQTHQPGELLRVRESLWRLRRHVTHPDCTQLELEPANPPSSGLDRTLLEPFDRPELVTARKPPRPVSRRAWMRTFVEAVAGERRLDRLLSPADASIDLLPYQLVPAMAMAQGIEVPRLLLADAVGLGKTIQAALVLAELRAHHQLTRGLILTPPGLREQWCDELGRRFGFHPVLADAAWLRESKAALPRGTSPWSVPEVLVASVDFVKRPDVRTGLDRLIWDVLIVDEAHAASNDTDRRRAVHRIAAQARRLLLLTATPHDGDPRAFASLCRVGALPSDGPIRLLRRSRSDVGFTLERRVRTWRVTPRCAERALHQRLVDYVGRIWRERTATDSCGARLAGIVLLKRACSSMAALARTLAFRLDHLGDSAGAMLAQLGLPLDGEVDESDSTPWVALAAPGLNDADDERETLNALLRDARAAAADDSRLRTLVRWLRRVHEPCVVFTEFRDTLEALAAVIQNAAPVAMIHGELDRAARRSAIDQFRSGDARVLLATDAAGEGLNLQASCRIVINVELPWNPVRLEQRIGRVDRIGQRRTVHAINLVGASVFESALLARLVSRSDHIRRVLGSFENVTGAHPDAAIREILADAEVLLKVESEHATASEARGPDSIPLSVSSGELDGALPHVRLRRAALEALARHTRRPTLKRRPLVTAIARSRLGGLDPGVYVVFRIQCANGRGNLTDECLVPMLAPVRLPRCRRRHDVTGFVEGWLARAMPVLAERAARVADERRAYVRWLAESRTARARARDAELVVCWEPPLQPVQAGLFEQRDERRSADARHDIDSAQHALGRDDGAADIASTGDPELAFVLAVTE